MRSRFCIQALIDQSARAQDNMHIFKQPTKHVYDFPIWGRRGLLGEWRQEVEMQSTRNERNDKDDPSK